MLPDRSHALPQLLRKVRKNPLVNRGLRATLGAPALRAWMPPGLWRRVPIHGEFQVRVPGYAGFVYEGQGEPLGKTLFWRGIDGFEPGTARVFIELCKASHMLFDVGAYSGYYTLLGLTVNHALRARCFEPVPDLRAWTLRQLERNGLERRAEVVSAAVTTGERSEVSFYVMHDTHAPSSSLHRDYGGEARSEIHVTATTLDAQAASVGRVDLIKIDAEGAEDAVLASGERLLREQRPLIICEILESGSSHLENIEQQLRRLDYSFAHIRPEGLAPMERLAPDPARRLRNFLLYPRERTLPAALPLLAG